MPTIDIWKAGRGEKYLYTDDPALFAELKRRHPRYGTYADARGIYAWQFILSDGEARLVAQQYEQGQAERQKVA